MKQALPMRPEDLGLPHRKPFVFLDWITEWEVGVKGVGTKVFLAEDPVFLGHFPGNPVVPGVLLCEAIAQLAGIVAGGEMCYLGAVRSMKFPAPALPNEVIIFRASQVTNQGDLLYFDGEAIVGERLVAKGSVILTRTK